MPKTKKAGFTLAELLIVVAIIGVLVGIGIPVFSAAMDKATETVCAANRRSALGAYRTYCMLNYCDFKTNDEVMACVRQEMGDPVCPRGGAIYYDFTLGVFRCPIHTGSSAQHIEYTKDTLPDFVAAFGSAFTQAYLGYNGKVPNGAKYNWNLVYDDPADKNDNTKKQIALLKSVQSEISKVLDVSVLEGKNGEIQLAVDSASKTLTGIYFKYENKIVVYYANGKTYEPATNKTWNDFFNADGTVKTDVFNPNA